MNTIENFRDRINSDAVFAAQFADTKSEDDFIELAMKQGYDIVKDDIYQEAKLTDEQLKEVQGGFTLLFIFVVTSLSILGCFGAAGGAGIAGGIAVGKKKR